MRPVQATAGEELDISIFDACLHAIAVELQLVQPVFAGGRTLRRGGELGFNELGQRLGLCAFGDCDAENLCRLFGRRLLRLLRTGCRFSSFVSGEAGARVPDMIGGAADGIEVAVCDDAVGRFIDDGGSVSAALVFVVLFDEQPVWLGLLRRLAAHADQGPVTLELMSVQDEFEASGAEAFAGIADRLPGSGVPQHDSAATVLSLRDGALEAAVLHRVVFYLNREPLVRDHVARPFGDGPAFEYAIPAETEVIMQPRGGVFLDHEREAIGGLLGVFTCAPRLRSGGEVTHLAITAELRIHRGGGTVYFLRGFLRACRHVQAALRRRPFAWPLAACSA